MRANNGVLLARRTLGVLRGGEINGRISERTKTAVDTLGATVLLPIVIFIIAVVLGAKVGKAFRAAITIGVAFIGINLVRA